MSLRALSRACAPLAVVALLSTTPSPADAALRVRPWSPLHARLTEIARVQGVPVEVVLAEPERWLEAARPAAGLPRALEPHVSATDLDDQPIRFGFPRLLGASLHDAVVGDFDGEGTDDVAAHDPATGGIAIFEGGGPRPLSVHHDLPIESGDVLLLAADLDGDGRADLVTGRAGDASLAVYRSLGGFAFAEPSRTSLGGRPQAAIAASFGGIAAVDLAVLTDTEVEILLGVGNLSFTPGARLPVTAGYPDLAAADFDDDGRTDLVVPEQVESTPFWKLGNVLLRNASDTELVRFGSTAPPLPFFLGPIDAGDVDGDGNADLVSASVDSLFLHRGNGTGGFEQVVGVFLGERTGTGAADPRIVDLDRDGRRDVVVSARIGGCANWVCRQLVVLRSRPGGGFDPPIQQLSADPNTWPGANARLHFGNFDGDGVVDAAVDHQPDVYMLSGDARQGFRAPTTVWLPFAPRIVRTLARQSGMPCALAVWDGVDTWLTSDVGAYGFESLSRVAAGEPIAVLDLDRDGLDDVLLAHGDTTDVWVGNGSSGLSFAGRHIGGTALAAADVDASGGPDLLVADATGLVHRRLNDGSGHLGALQPIGLTLPVNTRAVRAADLDRDGFAELVFGTDGGESDSIGIHWNLGGVFGEASRYPTGLPDPFFEVSLSFPGDFPIGDLDGNGYPDLLCVNATLAVHFGSLTSLVHAGPRTFLPPRHELTGLDPWEGLTADFDGDGRDDVAIALDEDTRSGVVQVYHAGPGGVLTAMHESTVYGMTAGHYTLTLAAGDWDGDRRIDLVAGNYHKPSLTFFRNLSPRLDPVAIAVSLVQAEARPDGVTLAWFASDAGFAGAVERARGDGAWTEVARVAADGAGHIAWTDRDVVPGARVGYRLRWAEGGSARRTAETWLDVPRDAPLALALHGAQPNPSRGAPVLAFTLPSAEPATLELFDVGGRRVASQHLNAPAPGRHALRLGAERALAPGLYLARVTQAGRSAIARVVVGE